MNLRSELIEFIEWVDDNKKGEKIIYFPSSVVDEYLSTKKPEVKQAEERE